MLAQAQDIAYQLTVPIDDTSLGSLNSFYLVWQMKLLKEAIINIHV